MGAIDKIFDSFIDSSLFKNKNVLQINYTPETIPHRDKEIEQIASILAPILRSERPSNLFIYGKTGTGKTLSVQFVRDELMKRAAEKNIPLKIEYINCKLKMVADTEYRIMAELIKKIGGNVPATGLPTGQVYNKFIEIVDKEKNILVLILDEIDQAVKKISGDFLYNLTRLNSELANTQLSIVGISNDLTFLDSIDPRVRSSLSEEELIFPPYNATQLQEILNKRAQEAFLEGALEEGVIQKCSAFAAQEHGDARRALDLLRIAAELAEREGGKKVKIKHIDAANEKIEKDKILDIISMQPKQFQLVILSIINLFERPGKQNTLSGKSEKEKVFTGDVYNLYEELCRNTNTEVLTQRRVSDIIAEFDMHGIINATTISKGRHGRTREIRLAIPSQILGKAKEILQDALGTN